MKSKLLIPVILTVCLLTYSISYGKDEKKARVIVICDASRSVSSANANKKGIDQLKRYAEQIPKWTIYPIGSHIYYYPVSSNLASTLIGDSGVCYNIQMHGQLNKEKRRVDALINKVKSGIDIASIETKNSCILLSINRAVNKFNEIKVDNKGEDSRNELIIISDLLECCTQLNQPEIQMSNLNLTKLDAELQKFTKLHTDLNVRDLNLTVRVIFNTPGMGAELNKIENVWRTWFYGVGVKKENLIFYTGEPEIQENPFLNKR